MRLQVFLSRSGACSRRRALQYIHSGCVTVNGQRILEPSYSVRPESDVIRLNGQLISLAEKVYILLHKPKGIVTTTQDPFAKRTVLDLLPRQFRHLYPVGRLDKDTTGLLILTNDGELTYRLSHPSFEIKKTYRVCLDRHLSPRDRERLQQGIVLDGKKTAPCQIKQISESEFEIVIHEGRKRQLRRMFASLHYHVEKLIRVAEGLLTLGGLKAGEWRFLQDEEVKCLYGKKEKKTFCFKGRSMK